MTAVNDYTQLISSEHDDKPKYLAVVESLAQPMVDLQNLLGGMPHKFDLDTAVDAQLDDVGRWVGISRNVRVPVTDVYFSFDITFLGFDQGSWIGPFDPDTGISRLDNETYRLVIRAKIGANHWDGTIEGSRDILDYIFSSGEALAGKGDVVPSSTYAFIQDNLDMSMTLGISGVIPPAVFLALLRNGLIPLKPEGVRTNLILVTSHNGSPVFGLDMDTERVAGLEIGAWGLPL